jgi:hypothetical protein
VRGPSCERPMCSPANGGLIDGADWASKIAE